jgi:hypothetical protein
MLSSGPPVQKEQAVLHGLERSDYWIVLYMVGIQDFVLESQLKTMDGSTKSVGTCNTLETWSCK